MNQMPGGMGSSDQAGMHSDSSLPSTLNKWVISYFQQNRPLLKELPQFVSSFLQHYLDDVAAI